MLASFIIRYHSARLSNLKQTLRFLSIWHKNLIKDCELITVCQDSMKEPLEATDWAVHKNFNLNLSEMSLPTVTNFGVSNSSCEKIVLLDGDRITPENYFCEVLERLESGLQICTKHMKRMIHEYSDEEIIGNNFEYENEFRNDDVIGSRNTWSGNLCMMKSDYNKIGGMDEKYIGYGWEDNDMCMKCKQAGFKSIHIENKSEIHLWHPRLTYGIKDQKQLFIDNGLRFCKKWNLPIPNIIREELAIRRTDIII